MCYPSAIASAVASPEAVSRTLIPFTCIAVLLFIAPVAVKDCNVPTEVSDDCVTPAPRVVLDNTSTPFIL